NAAKSVYFLPCSNAAASVRNRDTQVSAMAAGLWKKSSRADPSDLAATVGAPNAEVVQGRLPWLFTIQDSIVEGVVAFVGPAANNGLEQIRSAVRENTVANLQHAGVGGVVDVVTIIEAWVRGFSVILDVARKRAVFDRHVGADSPDGAAIDSG